MELSIYVEQLDPAVIFKSGGMDGVLEKIRLEVDGFVPDLTSDKGRKEIASLAHKVSKSKTVIDAYGKTLADQLNARIRPINNERKKCRDQLDELRDYIRKPLTDWEEEVRIRIEKEDLAADIAKCLENAYLINDIFDRDLADQLAKEEALAKSAEDDRVKAQEERDNAIRAEALENAGYVNVPIEGPHDNLQPKPEPLSSSNINDAHKAKVNNMILQKFVEMGVPATTAKQIILDIHRGEWPHVSITY